jgi:hypothetical protein
MALNKFKINYNNLFCRFLVIIFYLELLRASEGTWSLWSRRAIAKAKHRSKWPVIGWVNKIYYFELLLASEGTLSRWSRLHLQSLASAVSRWVDVRQVAGRKNNCRIFITTWWKYVVPTLLSGIRVGRRRRVYLVFPDV